MASSSFGNYDIDEGQYPYPSHVNTASFVSIKLSGSGNYDRWREQMRCLLDAHDMLGFIDDTLKKPEEYDGSKAKADTNAFEAMCRRWERSDKLAKGWIYGSLSEDIMTEFRYCQTAQELWKEIADCYHRVPFKHPCVFYEKYMVLYRAIELGDWETTQEFINQDKRALVDPITESGESALKIAISNHSNTNFLQNLLNRIEVNEESLPRLVTEVLFAIECGNKAAVEMLVNKSQHVLFIYGRPFLLEHAAYCYQRTILDYLFEVYKRYIDLTHMFAYHSPFKGKEVSDILDAIVDAEYFDVAYDLLKDCYDELVATVDDSPWGIANHLAQNPDVFLSAKRYNFYQRFVYSHVPVENFSLDDTQIEHQEASKANHVTWKNYIYPVMEKIYVKFWEFALLHVAHIKNLHEDKVKHSKVLTLLKFCCQKNGKLQRMQDGYKETLILAVRNNIPEVIEQITRSFPLSIRTTKDRNHTLYQVSIMERCENSYNFLVHEETYHMYLHPQISGEPVNNLLHLAAKLAPEEKLNKVTGAALQMQRELQWFEEVSKLVSPKERTSYNIEKETPMMVFRKQHKNLRQKGEDWMKQAANSYSIIAGLISTIVFAAVITVPGGNDDKTGKAIYHKRLIYIIFIISDAVSMFTSTTSLLLFLSILTARYADEDFLYKLPKRLVLGLIMLFMGVTAMLIAFSAALYIMSGHENLWIWNAIAAMTLLPITSFVTLQLPLLVDLISSTFGHGIFGRRRELLKTL